MRVNCLSRTTWSLLLGLLLVAGACGKREARPEDAPDKGAAPDTVAQVALEGGGLKVRAPGSERFEAWKGGPIARGSTLETGLGICSLNFMGSVQIELEKSSRLVLEGDVPLGSGFIYVLGLSRGGVRINSSADVPLVLRMPHAEVAGTGAYFSVKLERTAKGAYSALVTAFSPGLQVSNDKGQLVLPSWGVVQVPEDAPPKLVKNLSKPGR